jgi:phosphate starvation-inducible protein PhoH
MLKCKMEYLRVIEVKYKVKIKFDENHVQITGEKESVLNAASDI